MIDARVVHDDVDPVVALERGVHECTGGVAFGEIASDDEAVMERARQLLEPFDPTGRYHDPRPGGVEDAREARAQPRARAGDDRDAPVEAELSERIEVRHSERAYVPPGTRTLNLVMKSHVV